MRITTLVKSASGRMAKRLVLSTRVELIGPISTGTDEGRETVSCAPVQSYQENVAVPLVGLQRSEVTQTWRLAVVEFQ